VSNAALTIDVDVDAPAAVTWAAVTAWARQGEWMLGTRVRVTDPGPDAAAPGHGVGAGLEAITGRGPLAFRDTMVVTGWDPPRRCEVRHTGRVVRGTGIFEVVERGPAASRLVWTEELELPLGGLGSVGWRLLAPAFTAGVRHSLKRFARWAPGA
jgi:hypothetical protein